MSEIKVLGTEEIDGATFTGIEGGFGDGQRSMLVRDIAEAMGLSVKRINELINKKENRKRFNDGVEIMDLKTGRSGRPVLEEAGFTKAQVGNANNIYLLSERGYAKLLKIMDSDEAWEQYDKFVDGYFQYREAVRDAKPMTPLEMTRMAVVEVDDKVVAVEARMDEFEANALLSSPDYDTIGKEVSRKVHTYRKAHNVDRSQVGKLFQDLNGQIKEITQAPSRGRIKQKDFDMVMEFIDMWEPKTSTKMAVKQTELEV
ncbi:ORF6C domain-containing protein [Weissella tructae]